MGLALGSVQRVWGMDHRDPVEMGGFHSHGPVNGWFISWKILLKWMIWGHPYFRNPPKIDPSGST